MNKKWECCEVDENRVKKLVKEYKAEILLEMKIYLNF